MATNYKDLSRRGLIRLGNDYDAANDNALHNFLNDGTRTYEGIRPFEEVAARADDVVDCLKDKGDEVSKSLVNRMNNVFDSMIGAIAGETDRAETVLEEQNDGEVFSDDDDDDQED